MTYIYRTLDNGTTEIQQNGEWIAPWPSQPEIDFFNDKVAIWLPNVEAALARHGLPPMLAHYVLGIMHGEGAKPNYVSFDNGVGLMQITDSSLKKKPGGGLYTNDELKDPDLNIDIAVEKMIAREYPIMGLDLPQIASGYNGGFSPTKGANRSTKGPWGWREYEIPTTGAHPYISKVVRLGNYSIATLPLSSGDEPPAPDDFNTNKTEPSTDEPEEDNTSLIIGALSVIAALYFGVRYARS
jgi:hypothetical protein